MWDPVPWMVGGGAHHSAELARVLAYVAFRGNEGVLSAGDLKVKALGVPGASVTVDPGACSILCRSTGQLHQAYAGRLATQDTAEIAPTGAGAGRSDLIVARVEDPWLAGEPWADPADSTVGPYIFTRVIPNVAPTTKTVAELGLGYSAIELARIDIPASTGTITQAMIVDLRKIGSPRRQREVFTANHAGTDPLDNVAFATWPSSATWQVAVPPWATKVILRGAVSGLVVKSGVQNGELRCALGTSVTQGTGFYDDVPVIGRQYWAANDTIPVPAAMRGTTQTVRIEANRNAGATATPEADGTTSSTLDVEFVEAPE